MNTNPTETKHLPINFTMNPKASSDLTMEGDVIIKVKVAKLLGVKIQDNLKWGIFVLMMVSKASSRLRSLQIL